MGQNQCQLKNGDVVRYEARVFGAGEYKTAHRGTFLTGERKGKSCIVKAFKSTSLAFKNGNTVRVSRIAKKLATEFNAFNKTNSITPIDFLVPKPAMVTELSRFSCLFTNARVGDVVTCEDRIYGAYEKFVSNNGTLLYHGTLSTFCHWSYWKTKQRLMIVDLQGERRKDKYILTDPAIHSTEDFDGENFGELDCGHIGIEAFFSSHKCDKLCKTLPKPNVIRYTPEQCEKEMRKRVSNRA